MTIVLSGLAESLSRMALARWQGMLLIALLSYYCMPIDAVEVVPGGR